MSNNMTLFLFCCFLSILVIKVTGATGRESKDGEVFY
jgi:hypothetical protein